MLVSKKCIIFWIFLEKYLLELLFNKTIIIQKKILSLTYFLSLDKEISLTYFLKKMSMFIQDSMSVL